MVRFKANFLLRTIQYYLTLSHIILPYLVLSYFNNSVGVRASDRKARHKLLTSIRFPADRGIFLPESTFSAKDSLTVLIHTDGVR